MEFIAQGLGFSCWTRQPDLVLNLTTSKGKNKISPPQSTPETTVKCASKSGSPGFEPWLCVPEKRLHQFWVTAQETEFKMEVTHL